MKSEKSLRGSVNARRKHCRHIAHEIAQLMEGEQGKEEMAIIRRRVAKLSQCFHEYNAYRNALETK